MLKELIGLNPWRDGALLMRKVNPAFLILKPTLIGGLNAADEWVKLANQHQISFNHHRAGADAEVCAKISLLAFERLFITGNEEAEQLLSKNLKIL